MAQTTEPPIVIGNPPPNTMRRSIPGAAPIASGGSSLTNSCQASVGMPKPTGWPISCAFRSAAPMIALASSVETLGRSNVAATATSCLAFRPVALRGIPLLHLADLGQPDEIGELAEAGHVTQDC